MIFYLHYLINNISIHIIKSTIMYIREMQLLLIIISKSINFVYTFDLVPNSLIIRFALWLLESVIIWIRYDISRLYNVIWNVIVKTYNVMLYIWQYDSVVWDFITMVWYYVSWIIYIFIYANIAYTNEIYIYIEFWWKYNKTVTCFVRVCWYNNIT